MISLLKILNELEINNPSRPTNNKQLLDFLNKNKEKVIDIISQTENFPYMEDDEYGEFLSRLKDINFNLDNLNNPSIEFPEDALCYSFSLNEDILYNYIEHIIVDKFNNFGFPIYYIEYSI